MLASTRRFRPARAARRVGRGRATVATLAALTLGVAACSTTDDDPAETDEEEVEAPAEDPAVDDEGEATPPAEEDLAEEEEQAAPSFETLEGDEVVPGVSLQAPVDDDTFEAQPTPTGSAYVASLEGQTGAVTVNVEFEGQSIDELLSGIDVLVESGQAEVTSDPEDVEVEGADEAQRVELAAPGGQATATGIFAIADGNAISIAVEVLEDADIDVEAIIDSIVIDAERLQAEGTLELDEAPADDAGAGTEDAGADDAGEGTDDDADAADDAATDPEDDA
jgi:hypothetical protein